MTSRTFAKRLIALANVTLAKSLVGEITAIHGQRSFGRQCPFCWCVCVCGVEGGLGGHNQASNIALAAKY